MPGSDFYSLEDSVEEQKRIKSKQRRLEKSYPVVIEIGGYSKTIKRELERRTKAEERTGRALGLEIIGYTFLPNDFGILRPVFRSNGRRDHQIKYADGRMCIVKRWTKEFVHTS